MVYCFSTEEGEVIDRVFPMGEAPQEIDLPDGRMARRDYRAEQKPRKAGAGWPMECFASGVNAAQAPELRKFFKKRGFDCDVTPGGDPMYTSPSHRKRALKLRGFFDRSSYN